MNEVGTSTVKINFLPNTDTWPEYNFYQPIPIYTVSCRNYKCVCGGEFNTASYMPDEKGIWRYLCPFCGKQMEGMK